MAVAVFDYSAWSTLYPEFGGAVSAERAALLFGQAGALYLDNSDSSPVTDAGYRLQLLNLLVAHLAAMSGALQPGGVPSGIVGRITSATEGSVSVSSETGLAPGTGAWFQQTSYGFQFWQATKAFRSATYVAPPGYCFEPVRGLAWRR